MPGGDRVGEAYVDIHVNAGPGEAEMAAFTAKIDRDFAELGRKKAEAQLQLKSTEFDAKINKVKAELDNLEHRKARASVELDKAKFDAEIAEAKAEIKALGREKAKVRVDLSQLRAANRETRLLMKGRELDERAALAQAKAEQAIARERDRAARDMQRNGQLEARARAENAKYDAQRISSAIKNRAELARLSGEYEKLRGRQIGLEKSSRRVFSPRSIGQAEEEARKIERVASQADYLKHKIESLGGSVDHLDPQISRNSSLLDRWLSRLGDTSIRIGPITTSIKGLATGLGLLGPIIFELGGGLTALAGTIGSGLAGAAVVAGGAFAGFAASALGIGMVLKPMVGEFEEVHKAMEKVTKAERKYGKGSEQAKTAQEQLNNTLKGVSPVARKSFQDYVKLKSAFETKTSGAKAALFSGFEASLKTAKALLPEFASETVKTSQVAAKAWSGWMKALRSSEAKHILGEIMSNFRASIPGISSGLGSLIAMFGRLAAAGSHFLPGLSNGFAQWASNLERAVGGGHQLQHDVGGLVSQMRDLGHLSQDTGSLLVHIFTAGSGAGQGMVKSLDRVIQRWDKWTQSASGKSGLKEFFDQSKTATEDFFSSLGHLTKLLFEFSRATAPVANGLLQIVTWIGDIVSAADELVGVKQIFQAVGLGLAGLFIASKVFAFKDAVSGVIGRLGALVGASSAAAAATEAEAAAAADAAVAIEAEAVASAEAAAAADALGVSAAAGGAAMEGTAASAGVLGAVMAPEVLIPAAVAGGFVYLATKIGTAESAFVQAAAKFKRTSHDIPSALNETTAATDKYVTAQQRNKAATESVTAARKHLAKLQEENAPLAELTKAVNKLNAAESHQHAQAVVTGRINKQQIEAQKELVKGAKARQRAAENEVSAAKREAAMVNKAGQRGAVMPKSDSERAQDAKNLAKAERDLATAKSEVSAAQRQEVVSAIPYERSLKGLAPISKAAEQGLRKLSTTIGLAATHKIGKFVDPNDIQRVTELGNRLTKLGRGGQVKQIAVKSQGADQTISKLQKLQRQTSKVEAARATVKVGANDTQAQSKLKRLSALSQRVTGSRNTIRILANSANAEQAIQRLQSHLRHVAQTKYQAEVSAVDKTQPGWQAAYHHLRETASKKYEARINAIDNASGKAKDAEGNAKRAAKTYKLNITATNSQALGAISSVQTALAGLHDKTVTVNVVTHKSGGFSGGPAGMYYSTFATGGISDRELQRANEKAVVRQSGPGRKVNRPTMLVGEQAPRHPEYVIATNPAYRSSNEQYLEDAAGEFGYELIPAFKKGGKKGKASSGPGPAPYKKQSKRHWKVHNHKFAPKSVEELNTAEGTLQNLEGQFNAELTREEQQIVHGKRTEWDFALLKSFLGREEGIQRNIIHGLIPSITTASNKARERADKELSGPLSTKAVSAAKKQAVAAEGQLSKLKKQPGESSSAFGKKKAAAKQNARSAKKYAERLEKERQDAIQMREDATNELKEVRREVVVEHETALMELETETENVTDIEENPELAPYAGGAGSAPSLAEQTSSFNTEREELYNQFGSNISGGGATPFGASGASPFYATMASSGSKPNYTPAGLAAAGGRGGSAGRVFPAGTATVNNVNNYFTAPPPDPHTWAKQQAFELENL